VLGPDHPDTLSSRNNLAAVYRDAWRTTEAIQLLEKTLADQERVLGPDHPDSLVSRANLAAVYRTVGRIAEATALYETTLADCERVLGPDHPVSRMVGDNLAQATAQRPSGDGERRTRKSRWFRR
jgi:hypothetical protein